MALDFSCIGEVALVKVGTCLYVLSARQTQCSSENLSSQKPVALDHHFDELRYSMQTVSGIMCQGLTLSQRYILSF